MKVTHPTMATDELKALANEAHETICPYSHATRGNIDFSLEGEGK